MRRMILILLLAAFAVLLRADSPAVQPWSAGLNRAGRFRPNTSGRMSVEHDREAKAVRCSAERNGAAADRPEGIRIVRPCRKAAV